MKVILISDYFYPFTPGGSEWSVFELAKSLNHKKVKTLVVSLNYGTKIHDNYKGINIQRIPFIKKIRNSRSVVNPIWQNNPIFFIISAYFIAKITSTEKPDIIHVHGKFLIPGAIIAGFITKIPVIVTIRDKQILCPIGKCFFNPKSFNTCTFWQYFTDDFPWFIKYYTNRNLLVIAYAFFGAIWSRISGNIIKYLAKKAAIVTTISNSQRKYLESSGFKNVKVIYNTAEFKSSKIIPKKTKSVLFVGKLSKGKGIELLIDTIEEILKMYKVIFVFAGSIQSANIEDRLNDKQIKPYVKLLGNVNYKDLPTFYKTSSLLVMPSIYPESFGRAVLESLSVGTPVVVTNTGALPEIVEDKVTGRICRPTTKNLKEAILDVLQNEERYKKNIIKKFNFLKEKFMINPVEEYFYLYKNQTK